MTERQSKPAEKTRPKIVFRHNEWPRRTNREAVLAGLEFIFAGREDCHWTDFSVLENTLEIWVSSYVLTRLADVPGDFIHRDFRLQMEKSLDWLMDARTPDGNWGAGRNLEADADTTAWAVIALRRHGRKPPQTALEFIRGCQRPNGGFAAYPEKSRMEGLYKLGATDTTVAAMKALALPNPGAEEFLAARFEAEIAPSWRRLASRLHLCSELLEMEDGMVSWFLLNRVSQSTAQYPADNAFEQSLLLRCLLRLRLQRAWPEAAKLRHMQLQDGSWASSAGLGPAMPGVALRQKTHSAVTDDQRILTTVTAVSTLATSESQPGHYFGSDLPQPRRFSER